MNYHIRKVVPEDGPGIARVRVLAWQKAYRGLLPDRMLDSMNHLEEGKKWRESLGNLPSSRSIFVAEEDNGAAVSRDTASSILGFCACGPVREIDPQFSAEISALYVLPDDQGKGIGRALVYAAADWLRRQGHGNMIIYVLRDNFPARGFYEAVGGRLARERMWDIQGISMPEVGYGYNLDP